MTKGSRPEQAALSRNTDMSKTEEKRRVIEGMVDGLNDHRIDDIGSVKCRSRIEAPSATAPKQAWFETV